MKQCFGQRKSCQILLGSLVGCSIFSQICPPAKANYLPVLVTDENLKSPKSPPTTSKKFPITQSQISQQELNTISEIEFSPSQEQEDTRTQRQILLNSQTPPLTNSPTHKLPHSQTPPLLLSATDSVENTLTQQTAVSELSDVKPTDWAYQALKSLMEKYGVISGYADGTFRGNRPLSRYEFAAGLAATLDKVESLITDAIGDDYIQQDMIILRRLEIEFRSALDDLQKRTDGLEARNAKLEANQFSATTKLQGEQIFAITDGRDASSSVISRTQLTLLSSFSKKDLLVTQLESGNDGGDAVSLAQQENLSILRQSGFIGDRGGLDYAQEPANVSLRRLYYTLRPSSDIALTVGSKMSPQDFIDKNKYANDEAMDFSSSVFLNNPLIVQNQIDRDGGAGAAVEWNPGGGKITVRSLYIAGDANQVTEDKGLFGDPQQASVEVEYFFSDRLKLRLQYTNALVNNTSINAFGVNGEYNLNRNTGIFARLGLGNYLGFNTAINQDLDLHPVSWSVGVGLRNIVIPGTLAGIAIGQPFVADLGSGTQTNFETFYNLQLSDNISISPIITLVFNPDNDSDLGTIWQTTLRSVISF